MLDGPEGGLDLILETYKKMLLVWHGYLTVKDEIDKSKLEEFVAELSKAEPKLLLKKAIDLVSHFPQPKF